MLKVFNYFHFVTINHQSVNKFAQHRFQKFAQHRLLFLLVKHILVQLQNVKRMTNWVQKNFWLIQIKYLVYCGQTKHDKTLHLAKTTIYLLRNHIIFSISILHEFKQGIKLCGMYICNKDTEIGYIHINWRIIKKLLNSIDPVCFLRRNSVIFNFY